jgi:hypothetical protein
MSNFFKKIVGITAVLASTLCFSPSASALNLSIGNSSVNTTFRSQINTGQSFINDPSGTGVTINLDTWTFAFDQGTESTAAQSILTIYSGTGNGGSIIGTSSNTSTSTFASYPSVTWTFTGGLPIIDNSTYTAVLAPSLFYVGNLTTQTDPYPNGTFTQGTSGFTIGDLVFEGTFSAVTPVPFEFNPAIGLGILVGAWLVKKGLKRKV